MDWQIISVYSRLVLGALTVFLAIILWSKTQDIAWMLVFAGVFVMYTEIVLSVLERARFSLIEALPPMRMGFFIAAFLVMINKRRK